MGARADTRWTGWERYAAGAGIIAAIALVLYGILFLGLNITLTDSKVKVALAFTTRYRRVAVMAGLALIAVLLIPMYMIALWDALTRRAGRSGLLSVLMLFGGLGGVIVHAISDVAVMGSLSAKIAPRAVPDVAYGLFVVSQGIAAVGDALIGVFTIAAGISIVSTGAFARWMGWLGIAAGVLLILAGFGLGLVQGSVFGVLSLVGFVLFLVFVVISSVFLLQREGVVPESEALERVSR